jgi:isopentenyldiphosphate isomerase
MAERKFRPRPDQIDFTNARYCSVINCVIEHNGKILLVKRSKDLRLYPGYWNGVSGFLDDKCDIEEKVKDELAEELGIKEVNIKNIQVGRVLVQEAPKYQKTWIVFPVHVRVATDQFKLNWEASEAKWVTLGQAKHMNLLPGFEEVLRVLFG